MMQAQQSASPPSPESPLTRAEELLRESRPREALSLLTETVKSDPRAAGLERILGKAYFQSGQFPEAVAHVKAALQQDPNDVEASRILALSFYAEGNCHEALPLLEKLGPQILKDTPDAPYLLSICQVKMHQLNDARKSLAQMFSVSSDSGMAYLMLGKLLVREQEVDAAVPQIETALRLEPRLTMAHFLLGEIRLYQSKPQDAVEEFQKEMAVNPTVWLVYWRLGDAYTRVGRYDEAEKVLKEAIWLNDSSADAIVLLGKIALKKNDPALASGFLERALSLDPQNSDAHEAMAQAYKRLGRESDANRELETSQKLRQQKHTSGKDMLQTQ